MQLDKAFDSSEQTVPQARVMRAACGGGNQIDIALADGLAVFGEGHSPFSALAFGKAVMVAVCVAIPFEQGNDGVAIERLHQVVS